MSASPGCNLDLPPDPTSKAAQQELVEGLEPVRSRTRFLRALGPGTPSNLVDSDYNYRGTPAEAESKRVKAEIATNISDSDWPSEYDEGETVRLIFASAGEELELEFDQAALLALGVEGQARGVHHASVAEEEVRSPDEPGFPEAEPQGWSQGVDDRTRKEISSSYPANQRELRRIGRLDAGCTGVAVGRRLVLTAAHCVVQPDLSYTTHTYSARRSYDVYPYGTVTSVGYIHDSLWTANDCHLDRTNCHHYDWALLILPDDAWSGQSHPGWMGFSAPNWSDYQLIPRLYENGYPNHWSCYAGMTPVESGAPAQMFGLWGILLQSNTHVAYGQSLPGTVRDTMFPVDGRARLVHFSNDISCGHSGGAIWSDYPGSNGPYVLGISAYERCAGASCGVAFGTVRTHPNGARAMTPGLASLITQYRATYP